MKIPFSLFLVGRLLSVRLQSRYDRMRLLRSALLISLVMIPLVLALIFMDGMMDGITEKYITLQDGHIQIEFPERLDERIHFSDSSILSADYVVSGFGIVYSREATAEVRIKGIGEDYFNERRSSQLSFQGSALQKEGAVASVMLSTTVASQLGVQIGDRVAFMIVPDSSSAVVRPVLANVKALYDSGYHELDSSLIFMDIESALRYFPKEKNARTEILVHEGTLSDLASVVTQIESANGTGTLSYATWDEFNGTVYRNFVTSRQVILLVFLMILLVAGVYVGSIAQEMIQDSLQSIALYKTMGATTLSLFLAFLTAVMTITLLGMTVGVGIGLGIGSQLAVVLSWLAKTGLPGLQYYLLDFPVVISWRPILTICATMLVICSVTVQFSLHRIRKISPLELLQQD